MLSPKNYGSGIIRRVHGSRASRGRSRWMKRSALAGSMVSARALMILRYTSRFTPRRRGSIWSAVNIKRARELSEKGLMKPPGMAAFNARKENKSGIYSYEQRSANLDAPYEKRLRQNKAAWDFFYAQPPPYRKAIGWWIVSAKQEATRLKRLEKLIEGSANRKRLL